ncbi:hypothetical protein [Actinopolymorpha sp. B9G3]|uniref:hypothetical protein n=1 Tax=Actinopolymorpha sp. B9G3 TaxID=3158970 RepID=UPI0032D92F2B
MEPAQPVPTVGPPTTTPASTGRAAAWRLTTFRTLRILVTVQAAIILAQAITAGLLLSGTPNVRGVHGLGAILLVLIGLVQVVVAILHWRPGRGTARLLGPSIGILVGVLVQAMLGETHNKALHVPFGVLMFGGLLMLTRQLWSAPADRAPDQAQGRAPDRAPDAAPGRAPDAASNQQSGPARTSTPASGGQP